MLGLGGYDDGDEGSLPEMRSDPFGNKFVQQQQARYIGRMTDKPKRRRFRFSLRSLLVLVVILAIPLGWIAKERRQSQYEKQFVDQMIETHSIRQHQFGGPYDSEPLRSEVKPQGWWRDLARHVLGERHSSLMLFHDDPKSLASFTKLRELRLYGQFSDATPLTGLKRLKILDLSGTNVGNLQPLVGFNRLRSLYLDGTPVSDLTPLARLKQLRSLALEGTSVSDLTPLAGLDQLEWLGLSSTQVSDISSLGGLVNLKSLSLIATQVSDLTPLAGLTKLTELDVTGTSVSTVQIESLQKALPNCAIQHDPIP